MTPETDGHDAADAVPDPPAPAAVADLVRDQRARVAAATVVDGRLLFVAWGLAWLIGYGMLWVSADGRAGLPLGVAVATFFALLIAAGVTTAVHVARRTSGIRGTSSTQSAMFGWAWFAVFMGQAVLNIALGRLGASDDVSVTVNSIVPALLVAALYMAGGAMWNDRTQFALGAWIALSTLVAAAAGPPGLLLVMSLAGGGGMLVAAVVGSRLRGGRRRSAP
jgi:hypothetical protein